MGGGYAGLIPFERNGETGYLAHTWKNPGAGEAGKAQIEGQGRAGAAMDWMRQMMPELFSGMGGGPGGGIGASGMASLLRGGGQASTQPTGLPAGYEAKPTESPAAYNEEAVATPGGGNVASVVAASKPQIQEQMQRYMAEAAAKLGGLGALRGSGYAKELGKAGRKATSDIGSIIANTTFKAAESDAARKHQGQQNKLQRLLQGWQTKGGWDQAANQAEAGRDFDSWRTSSGYEQERNQRDADRGLQAQQQADRARQQWSAQSWPMIIQMMQSAMGA
jgi:hypothetical protein